MKYNYHTHTYLCNHAVGDVEDYVKAAIVAGYQGIGFSDHGPLKPEWTFRMNKDKFANIYLKNIKECQKKYQGKIEIFSGLEIEYYEKYDELYKEYLQQLDYLILGQHELSVNNYSAFQELPFSALEIYKNDCIKAMNTGYFKIFAHPDVILHRNHTWNKEVEAIYRELIECAIKNKVYLEINCNGIRNNVIVQNEYKSWSFPRTEFWKLVKEYPEALVIIGVDAHDPAHLSSESIKLAYEFKDKLGLNVHNEKI